MASEIEEESLGLRCSTPEPKEGKRERREEESRGWEVRSQKLKSLETIRKDESGPESAERCYPTSHCECWMVFRNGDRERIRNRASERSESDPDASRGMGLFIDFVPNDRCKPNVKLLGTFTSPAEQEFPWPLEERDKKEWYVDLVEPVEYVTHISSPFLSLFFLSKFIHEPDPIYANGEVLRLWKYRLLGRSISLPLHPPPSLRIPIKDHHFKIINTEIRMVGSCNGLYCMREDSVTNKVSVIVWNPTTGIFRKLPSYLPSNPVSCNGVVFGFGYDQSSDDYKVVMIDADARLVEVFSLYSNSKSWRSVQGFPQEVVDIQRIFSNGAIYFEGCLNWLVSARPGLLASFDLTTERFQFLPLPPTYGLGSVPLDRSSLCILDGSLSFVGVHNLSSESGLSVSRRRSRVLDIWIMRGYGVESSWTNAATLVFPHSVSFPYRILYLSKDVLVLAIERVLVFNLKDNSLMCPHIDDISLGVEPHVESRVSPYTRCNFSDKPLEITPGYPLQENQMSER